MQEEEIGKALIEYLSMHDIGKLMSLFTDDAVYVVGGPVYLREARGKVAIRELFTDVLTKYYENLKVDIKRVITTSGVVVLECTDTGISRTTGRRHSNALAFIVDIENGKIKYVRDHWNVVDMYNQVGWDCGTLNQ